MLKRVILMVVVLALVLSAQSIRVEVQDFHNNLQAIASKLSLKLGLPGGGLPAVWPKEVKSIGELGSVVATINNAGPLDKILDEMSRLGTDDFVVFTPTDNTAKWQAEFFTRGNTSYNGELKDTLNTQDFFSACTNCGIRIPSRKLALLNGVTLMGTIEDPEAFRKGFKGTDEDLQRGQTVFLMPGKSGTQAVTGHGNRDMPIWGFQVNDRTVSIIK